MSIVKYNGKIVKYGSKWVNNTSPVPPIPVVDPYTIRFQFSDTSYVPTTGTTSIHGTWTQISPGVWDWYYVSTSWLEEFRNRLTSSVLGEGNQVRVLNANTSRNIEHLFVNCSSLVSVTMTLSEETYTASACFGQCSSLSDVNLTVLGTITNANSLFFACSSLVSAPLFDTSHINDFSQMFAQCSSLTDVPAYDLSSATTTFAMFQGCRALRGVPLLDLSNVTDAHNMFSASNIENIPNFNLSSLQNGSYMFSYCLGLKSIPLLAMPNITDASYMFMETENIEEGALAMYQQLSGMATPPSHSLTFTNCGSGTAAGRAELAQIPTSWGGTAS